MSEHKPAESSRPAFSDEFRERIAMGKYTVWAADLTEEQLEALLWAAGEYGVRAEGVLECLDRHEDEFQPPGSFLPRARLGLELLAQMVKGRRFTVEDVKEQVRATVDQWRRQD
jgi:hypothetical protein